VNNNGKVVTQGFTVKQTGPGIFTDTKAFLVPTNTAARGQEIALYMTGAGQTSPAVFTGSAPAAGTLLSGLPQPLQKTTVMVNNVPANIDFVGIPPGLVGVLQINFDIPVNTPIGLQTVIVTVGNGQSGTALLNVTN
jgi:uncharacterized protein (TIGR03437 family)